MRSERIFYLMSGAAHLPYLICSLHTLRDHYDGEVVVYAWSESIDIVEQIARDRRLNIEARFRAPAHKLKNAQFMDKIQLAWDQQDAVRRVLYLDADTTIHGRLDRLFVEAKKEGFAATQFCDWKSNHGIPLRRIVKLKNYRGINQAAVDSCCNNPWPSVNGGVWAADTSSEVLTLWYKWTKVAQSEFIADEVVLHTLVPIFFEDGMSIVGSMGEYNTSPKFQCKDLPDDEVIVYHFHGDSNVRPDKTEKGFNLWWPLYKHCLEANIGRMADWIDKIDNKWMKPLQERDKENERNGLTEQKPIPVHPELVPEQKP